MNKLFSHFVFLFSVGLTFFSCSNELNTVVQEESSVELQTRSLEDRGEIIPVEESPYKRKDLSLIHI